MFKMDQLVTYYFFHHCQPTSTSDAYLLLNDCDQNATKIWSISIIETSANHIMSLYAWSNFTSIEDL